MISTLDKISMRIFDAITRALVSNVSPEGCAAGELAAAEGTTAALNAHPPSRHCMCAACAPSFEATPSASTLPEPRAWGSSQERYAPAETRQAILAAVRSGLAPTATSEMAPDIAAQPAASVPADVQNHPLPAGDPERRA